MRKHISLLLAAACVSSIASLAVAQFSDNFETAPVATPDTWAQQQAKPPAERVDADPANTVGVSFSALAGQWFHGAKSATPIHDIQVTTQTPPGPPPGGGNNFLRVHRSGNDCAITAAFADWNAGITGGTITADWDMYLPGQQTPGFIGGFYISQFLDNDHGNGTTGSLPVIFIRNSGVFRQSFNGFNDNPDLSSPAGALNQWQHYKLVANLTAGNYTVSVDGVTSAPAAFNFPVIPTAGAKGLTFNGQEGAEYYVDNLNILIPEPASIGLLALAGLGLVRRRV